MLVSFWKHPLQSTSASGTPTSWLNALPGPVIEVHCACKPETAAQRFLARQRHAGHLDHLKRADEVLESLRQLEVLGHLGIGELVRVDTSVAVDVETVVGRLRERGCA